MIHRRTALGASLLLLLGFSVIARAQTEQRSLYTSVLDKDGKPVEGLTPADFLVREDNTAREVLRVEPATTPMQIALLVDNSSQSRNTIGDIRDASAAFIKAVTGTGMKNEVALITVAERPTILVAYTADRMKLLKGSAIFTQPMSGAYMLDGILESAQGLKKREAARPVIVCIATDGRDLSYRYFRDQVMGAVKDAGAALNVIMVGPPPSDFTSDVGRERAYIYSEGTQRSGGRYDNVLAQSALPARLTQLADELTHQYLVTYAHPQSLIPPDKITITSRRAGLTVRGTPAKGSK